MSWSIEDTWLAVCYEDEKGQKCYSQFANEEELRFFLSYHEDYKVIEISQEGEN